MAVNRVAASPGPTGPWTFRGTIMSTQGSSFTNHAGVIDFNGGSYFFYHNGALPGGGGYTRSVAVEKFSYNADGTFPVIATIGTESSRAVPIPVTRLVAPGPEVGRLLEAVRVEGLAGRIRTRNEARRWLQTRVPTDRRAR